MKKNTKNKSISTKFSSTLPILNKSVAGIDLGSREHWVCVPADRDDEPIRTFGVFTSDLHDLAIWLKKCGITSIVIESTGNYWMPVFTCLERHKFDVLLVNARDAKNLPGRKKTDKIDCQWLQKLGTYGLLNKSFVPSENIRDLRGFINQRDSLTKMASSSTQRIQKAFIEMNIFIHNVISSIFGVTGKAIIKDIISGERDPNVLLKHKHARITASNKDILKSLTGEYTKAGVERVRINYELYEHLQIHIKECDSQILALLSKIQNNSDIKCKEKDKTRIMIKNIMGVDLTKIIGFKELTVLKVLSKTGFDFTIFQSENHFASWLGLSPNNS